MGAMLLTVKPYVLALYAAFGIVLLWSAVPAHARQATPTNPSRDYTATGRLVLAGVAGLMAIAYLAADSVLLLCALGIAASADKTSSPSTWLDRLSASAVVLSLVWWRIQPSGASPLPLAAFSLILVILLRAFRKGTGPSPAGARLFPIIVFLAAGVALVADVGGYLVDRSSITTMVHHWGAFIGPVLHVQAGLVPFYDVPLQYGLGPTVALAAACRVGGCWSGAHALFATTDVAMALLILTMALTTTRQRGWAWTCAVTAAIFSAAFLWPGFPAEGSLLLAMPSAGGVRFLPVTAVACLWFFGRPNSAALVAIPAVLWSPESAAMTIAVHGLCGTLQDGLRKSVISSAALLFGSYAALILLHRVAFGVWMDPAAFVEYVLHVPGPLPIDPLSDILLLGIVLGLGGWLAATAPEAIAKRRDMAATGLLFATATYCFGRSHPNNICNLMPFLALVGVRALDRVQAAGQTIVAQGLAVSVAALAFSTWRIVPLDPRVGADDLAKSFPAFEADVASIRDRLPRDQKLGIADFGPARSRHYAETIIWTPMDPSSLWSYVPSERRQLYIVRSARRLGRSGWGIFAGDQRVLLDDLRAGYDMKVERRINADATTYTVACFDPKPAVAVRIGSACPDTDLNGLEMARGATDKRALLQAAE